MLIANHACFIELTLNAAHINSNQDHFTDQLFEFQFFSSIGMNEAKHLEFSTQSSDVASLQKNSSRGLM